MNGEDAGKKLVLAAAVAIGIICALPHFLIPALKPADIPYAPMIKKGITAANEDEATLGSIINKVFRSDVIIAREAHLYENRHTPSPREWLPYMILGAIRVMTGSVASVFLIGDLLFPPLMFLCVYALAYGILRQRYPAALIGVSVLFLYDFLQFIPPRHFQDLVDFGRALITFTKPTPFLITRLPSPELTVIFFWLALIALFRFLERPNGLNAVLTGAAWGSVFYMYVYYWQAFSAGAFFVFLYLLARREWKTSALLAGAGFMALAVSLPFWLEVIRALHADYLADYWMKYGTRFGHYIFKYLTIKYLVITALGLFLAGRDPRISKLICFMAGGLVCMNQQMILGKSVEPDHWPSRFMDPWSVFYLGICFFLFLSKRRPERPRRWAGIATVCVLLWAAWIQTAFSMESKWSYPKFRELGPHLQAFAWLDSHTRDTDVVLTLSPETIDLSAVYAHNYNFLPYFGISNIPFKQVEDRLFTAYKLLGVPEDFLRQKMEFGGEDAQRQDYYRKYVKPFRKDPAGVLRDIYESDAWAYTFFHQRYFFDKQLKASKPFKHPADIEKRINAGGYRYVPKEERERLLKAFEAVPDDPSVLIGKYKLDYVYWGPYERGIAQKNPEELPFLKKVYDDPKGEIAVYRVLKPKKRDGINVSYE